MGLSGSLCSGTVRKFFPHHLTEKQRMLICKEEWSRCAEDTGSEVNASSDFLSLGSSLQFPMVPEAQSLFLVLYETLQEQNVGLTELVMVSVPVKYFCRSIFAASIFATNIFTT